MLEKTSPKQVGLMPILLILSTLMRSAPAADLPLTVEDSGSKEVDALVLQLVSTRPAPHPSGDSTSLDTWAIPYMTSQVSNALVRLKAMGPPIFPALVKHLQDDRYCYSSDSAAWENCTVGDAVRDVLCDEHHMFGGYKWRHTPTGGGAGYPSFGEYLKEREPEKWAAWATNRTRLELQLDFIDWCVIQENKHGFTDEAQRRQILQRYKEARDEVTTQFAMQPAPAKDVHRSSSTTNQASPQLEDH